MKPDRIVYLSDQPGHTSLFNSLRGQFGGELVVFPNDAPDFTQVSKFENSLVFAGSSINAKGWNNIFRELEKKQNRVFSVIDQVINSTHRFAAADQTDVTFLFLDPGIENIYRLRHGLKYSYCLPDLRLDRKRIRVENDNLVKELRMIGEPVSHITSSPYDEYWLEKVVSSSEVSNFVLTAAAHPREKQKKYRYLRQANTNLVPSHAIGFVSIKLLELWLLGVKAVAIDIDIEDSFLSYVEFPSVTVEEVEVMTHDVISLIDDCWFPPPSVWFHDNSMTAWRNFIAIKGSS